MNLALRGLPKFTCLPEDRGQYGPTIHLLPDEKDVMRHITRRLRDGAARRARSVPDHRVVHPHDRRSVAARTTPATTTPRCSCSGCRTTLKGTTWEAEEAQYVEQLLSICDRFAPGTSDLVVDTFPLHPPKIEQHFGITRGHIHHVDNGFGFADRLPYATPVDGLYSCSAGCHPAGSVIGAAGHNAAKRVLKDLKA